MISEATNSWMYRARYGRTTAGHRSCARASILPKIERLASERGRLTAAAPRCRAPQATRPGLGFSPGRRTINVLKPGEKPFGARNSNQLEIVMGHRGATARARVRVETRHLERPGCKHISYPTR